MVSWSEEDWIFCVWWWFCHFTWFGCSNFPRIPGWCTWTGSKAAGTTGAFPSWREFGGVHSLHVSTAWAGSGRPKVEPNRRDILMHFGSFWHQEALDLIEQKVAEARETTREAVSQPSFRPNDLRGLSKILSTKVVTLSGTAAERDGRPEKELVVNKKVFKDFSCCFHLRLWSCCGEAQAVAVACCRSDDARRSCLLYMSRWSATALCGWKRFQEKCSLHFDETGKHMRGRSFWVSVQVPYILAVFKTWNKLMEVLYLLAPLSLLWAP